LKVRELITLIEADGWRLLRVRGSHRQFVHDSKPGVVTVPGKLARDLPIGTERSILETGRDRAEVAVSTYAIIIERADDGGYGA
jgi:predicted RNA binding protein YcfA (HicA-like mRNA interferase family)